MIELIISGLSAIAALVGAAAATKTAFGNPPISNRTSSNDIKEVCDKLGKLIGSLLAKVEDYKKQVEQHEIKEQSEVEQWIEDIMEFIKDIMKFIGQVKKESEKSSSNCIEEMKKKLEKVSKLLEYGNRIEDQLKHQLKSVVKKEEAPCIEKIQTFQDRLMDVLESLKNEKVCGIIINGMIGVGKTTIMLNLNNHNEVAKSFDVVIWVDVSKVDSEENLDTKDLQCQILKRLNKESTEDALTNATRISTTLMDKKFLLLLDDVKENLDLKEIGIPDYKNGSKVVLTTRHNEICCFLVNKVVVNVTTLSMDDALKMFRGILQDPKFDNDPEKYYPAVKALRDCDYIPRLIKQLAETIKLKINVEMSSFIWKNRLGLLHEQESKKLIGKYYNLLKGFYYRQMDDVQKRCFLFGALFPEESRIYFDHLMECLAAVHFDDNDHEKATLDVCEALEHLINLSLFEESKVDCVTMQTSVTMRRLIRKMALYCALSEDPECVYLVKTDGALQESPGAESWRNKHYVSLCRNNFDWLPPNPECCDLSALLLRENLNLTEIPGSFFQDMKSLKVLDMSQTGIESLPSHISESLKVLYLRDCESLKQLNFAIRLPCLEVLDIQGSKIHNILTHSGNLERLRRLWISFEKYSVENGTEVRFSQLSALEELVIHMESFDQWSNKVLIRDIIKEVASLEKLRSLQFCFPDKGKVINVIKVKPVLQVRVPHVEILQIFIGESCLWRKFSHKFPFLLFIGCQISEYPHIPLTLHYEKYIKYCDGEGTDSPISAVLVIANVEAFELVNHKDIVQLSDIGRVDCALSKLQHLYLKDLPNMTNIWSKPGECGSLVKLKTLVLSGCPMLTTIFPAKIIQLLRNMKSLTVENCSGAVKIFEKFEDHGNGLNQLPNLKEMELKKLPNLENIWADESSKCQSLKELTLVNCPGIVGKPLKINAPNLERFVRHQ